jgi:hypothetical protein
MFFLDDAGLHETGMETAVITGVGVRKITMQFRFFFYDPKVSVCCVMSVCKM